MQRILITGATGGIGRALIDQLSSLPETKLALTGRSESGLSELPDVAIKIPADLMVPGAATAMVDEAAEAMGGLDVVVHLCGVGLIKPIADTSDGEFARIVNVNLRTTFLVAQAACAIMAEQKSGRFITPPGILGRAVMKNAAAYTASKFAVTGLIKSFAEEYRRAGIQFSLFFFGGVATPFWDDLGMKIDPDKVIPPETAAGAILGAITAPPHLVLSEYVLQPESHQLV
ncbi:MAG: SDR family oxidoreductase [Chthoniobacterales bacterium]